jgi:glycosyltransferase involved in cell wall biosynthesis
MNILILGNYPPPYGGVPHHIERLSNHLNKLGHTCHIISGGTTGFTSLNNNTLLIYKPNIVQKILSFIIGLKNIPYFITLSNKKVRLNFLFLKHLVRYIIYYSIAKRIVNNHKIDLISSYNILSYSPIASILSKQYSIPHIINIFGEVYKNKLLFLSNKIFFFNTLENSTKILSCSNHCGNSLKEIGFLNNVITQMYGINLNHFKPGSIINKNISLYQNLNKLNILFVGRQSLEMGLDIYIDVSVKILKENSNLKFFIVGQIGDFSLKAKNIIQVNKENFFLIDNANYNDLADYYRLADIVVIPTRGDRTCSSLAAMEAMATKKPVIAFSIGGIPELINNLVNGILIEPDNIGHLKDSILNLANNQDLRNILATNAYKKAIEMFNEDKVNDTITKYFAESV